MGKIKNPPHWYDVYPQGIKEGDEEQRFFKVIARHPKWKWRSIAQIALETKLTRERVEEIIKKYEKKGMIFNDPDNEDMWGYWERVPHMIKREDDSLSDKDKNSRINKTMGDDEKEDEKSQDAVKNTTAVKMAGFPCVPSNAPPSNIPTSYPPPYIPTPYNGPTIVWPNPANTPKATNP